MANVFTIRPVQFTPGQTYRFLYNGKERLVRVEEEWTDKQGKRIVRGFDYFADYPTGGYRSFVVSKIRI